MERMNQTEMYEVSLEGADIKAESDTKGELKEFFPAFGNITDVKKETKVDLNDIKNGTDDDVFGQNNDLYASDSENEDSKDLTEGFPIFHKVEKRVRKPGTRKKKKQKFLLEKHKAIVDTFLSGDTGSPLMPITYKNVVMTKDAGKQCYNFDVSVLEKYRKDMKGQNVYSCEDCDYTNEFLNMFKVHFMMHANINFIQDCVNTKITAANFCYMCDFKCVKKHGLKIHMLTEHKGAKLRKYERKAPKIFEKKSSSKREKRNASKSSKDKQQEIVNVSDLPWNCEGDEKDRVKNNNPLLEDELLSNIKIEYDSPMECNDYDDDINDDIKPFIGENDDVVVKGEMEIKVEVDDEVKKEEQPVVKKKKKKKTKSSKSVKKEEEIICTTNWNEIDWEDDLDGDIVLSKLKEIAEQGTEQVEIKAEENEIEKEKPNEAVSESATYDKKNRWRRYDRNRGKVWWSCNICEYTTKREGTAYKKHTCLRSFPCHLCNKVYFKKFVLDKHLKHHVKSSLAYNSTTDSYDCGICNSVFEKYENLRRHVHTMHCTETNRVCGRDNCVVDRSYKYQCNDCSKSFLTKSTLRNHIDKLHPVGNVYKCSVCKLDFKSRYHLTKHKAKHSCTECCFDSPNLQEVFEHRKTHEKDGARKMLSCTVCKYTTKEEGNLRRHVLTHGNPTFYVCSTCGFKTKQKGNLQTHEKSHIQGMDYHCTICTYKSHNISSFRKHKKTHGLDENAPMIQDPSKRDPRFLYCDKCEFRTKYPQYYKSHMFSHDKIKPYLCSVCGTSFSSSIVLNIHRKTHVEDLKKLYKCTYCNYTYHIKQTVMVHERKHTGIKPYKCEQCPYTTSYSGTLSAHRKKHMPPDTLLIKLDSPNVGS